MSNCKAAQIAKQEMHSGHNCCQSVMLAARQVWSIPIGDDLIAAGEFFGAGMGSGCTCGALAGMIMAAGVMEKYHPHPEGDRLPQLLHDRFKEEFGSTCCRVIKKKRSIIDKIGNRACTELTGKTAGILYSAWEGTADGQPDKPASGIDNNSDLK